MMIDFKTHSLIENAMPFWNNLNENQRQTLIDASLCSLVEKGNCIHRGDTDCPGLILVKSGCLRIYLTSDDGKQVTLFWLEEGEICILSASCILDAIDFEVSIMAETDCEIVQISSVAFSQLVKENVSVELFLYKSASQRFSDVMWALQQVLFYSFDKRLALFLLEQSDRLHTSDINITHEEIAMHLGSAREVVTRMLRYFSKNGIVSVFRGRIQINDYTRLKAITK